MAVAVGYSKAAVHFCVLMDLLAAIALTGWLIVKDASSSSRGHQGLI